MEQINNLKKKIELILKKIWILFRKDWITLLSYRFSLFTLFFTPIVSVVMFGIFGRVIQSAIASELTPYGGDYVSFMILGIILWQFVSMGLNGISSTILTEINRGTFEAIFVTQTNTLFILFSSTIFSTITTAIFSGITILASAIFLSATFHLSNYGLAILIILLTYLSTLGIGFIVAALTLVTKNIGALLSIITTLIMFLSGVYYPVSILPAYMQTISKIIPLTYALDALRRVLLGNSSLGDVRVSVIVLLTVTIITIPVGIIAYNKGLERARKDGTLAYY